MHEGTYLHQPPRLIYLRQDKPVGDTRETVLAAPVDQQRLRGVFNFPSGLQPSADHDRTGTRERSAASPSPRHTIQCSPMETKVFSKVEDILQRRSIDLKIMAGELGLIAGEERRETVSRQVTDFHDINDLPDNPRPTWTTAKRLLAFSSM